MTSKEKALMNFKENSNREVIFVGKYMEIYIPNYYFENNMARMIDDKVETLGIFMFRVYSDESKKEKAEMHTYTLPSLISTKPSNIRKDKLSINGDKMDFTVLEYYKNDIFITDILIVQSSAFANQYITFYHNGKIPNFVNYDDTFLLELETTFINKMKFPVTAVLLEGIASEINRDKEDISKPFRYKAAEGAGKHDYQPVSIKQLPSFNSTFSSVTFEDIDYQLISSVNKTRYKKEEMISPLEETIKY